MPTHVEPSPHLKVRQIIEELSPGQLWSLLTTLGALVLFAFTAGQKYAATQAVQAVPCKDAANWPVGPWRTWGHVTHAGGPPDRPFPQITAQVTFDSSGSGTSLTDEKGNNLFTFTMTPPLTRDGRTGIEMNGKDSTGYTSQAHLALSNDGCMLQGTFTDSYEDAGTLYFLYVREEYLVRR